MSEFTLSIGPLIGMGISALVSIGLPIGLLIYQIKKKEGRIGHFLLGCGIFILFALVLESISHQFFLMSDNPISKIIGQNKWLFILYASMAAGIFEETGRFIAFKFFMKKTNDKNDAITYGVGHGGVEAIMLVGIGMVSSIVLLLTVHFGGMESYLSMVPEGIRAETETGIIAMSQTPTLSLILGALERVIAIAFHISVSVLVFFAAKRKGMFYLYPLSILLHALLNVPAGMYQSGIIKNPILLEGVTLIIGLAVAYFAVKVYQNDKETTAVAEASHYK